MTTTRILLADKLIMFLFTVGTIALLYFQVRNHEQTIEHHDAWIATMQERIDSKTDEFERLEDLKARWTKVFKVNPTLVDPGNMFPTLTNKEDNAKSN